MSKADLFQTTLDRLEREQYHLVPFSQRLCHVLRFVLETAGVEGSKTLGEIELQERDNKDNPNISYYFLIDNDPVNDEQYAPDYPKPGYKPADRNERALIRMLQKNPFREYTNTELWLANKKGVLSGAFELESRPWLGWFSDLTLFIHGVIRVDTSEQGERYTCLWSDGDTAPIAYAAIKNGEPTCWGCPNSQFDKYKGGYLCRRGCKVDPVWQTPKGPCPVFKEKSAG